MHLSSLTSTEIHLYALTCTSFTCMHSPSLACTYIHLHSPTFTCRPKFSAWVAWSVKVPKIGTWSVKPVMHGKCDLSYKMRSTRWVIQYRTDRKASYVTVGVGCTEGTSFVRAKGEISRTRAHPLGEKKSKTNQKTDLRLRRRLQSLAG